MQKTHVKKGDEVVIIAGSNKGKRGKVIEVQRASQRIIVEGACMIKRHVKKNQQNPNGAIIEREGTVHISNVMKADLFDASKKRKTVEPVAA
ncbi:MAG TPA: 50S ribosomal protein L24 [Candidatus Limnocylindria bacterium]|nr:50S ribosomal protein L24 [Candidatus Limnocylindria bacterium]